MHPKFKKLDSALFRFTRKAVFVALILAWVLVLALWVRGYWVYDILDIKWQGHHYFISSSLGRFHFEHRISYHTSNPMVPVAGTDSNGFFYRYGTAYPSFNPTPLFKPFDTSPLFIKGGYTFSGRAIQIPAFIPLILLSLALPWAYQKRKQRIPAGHCQSCGYNLTGNHTATNCPECGKPHAPLTPDTSNPSAPRI
jgi:hypothetical protein